MYFTSLICHVLIEFWRFKMTPNDLQIGGRFNAANVLLALVALRGL
jgi:UDP-N-acetylmuramyl tripeptide synthase